jgi:glycosyltransferase involved in cell wall biosynthesis
VKVVQVIPSLSLRTGGPAVNVTQASDELAKSGLQVKIVTTDLARPASARHRGSVPNADLPTRQDGLETEIYPSCPPRRFAASPALGKALRNCVPDCDVVHIHSLFLHPQYCAYRAAVKAKVPYVVSPRGALDPWLRQRGRFRKWLIDAWWQREMLEEAAAIHLTSEQEAEFTADIAPGTPRYVIPNGIRWGAFERSTSGTDFRRRALNGFEGPLVLVHGRLTRKKGLDLLIRAIARVSGEFPDCRLAIVGPDDEILAPELKSVAEDAGVADRIHFCGMLTGSDLREALFAADVWALPSHTENFAVAAVEALAAGCPVVLSPGVGVAAEAEASDAAIVRSQDPADFAAGISTLLRDASAKTSLGQRARSYARRFDWRSVAPQMIEMYEGVIP